MTANLVKTYQLIISGIVQGVGFRPFIFRMAKQYGLRGFILNDSRGVEIQVQGVDKNINQFCESIKESPPPRSLIHSFEIFEKKRAKFRKFEIRFSQDEVEKSVPISPDLFVCEDCLRELLNPADRRYYYPFINCTNCGPRYSIVQRIPYDRCNTTMNEFQMCPECKSEYHNPESRRFHAQPNACPVCGPKLDILDKNGDSIVNNRNDNKTIIQQIVDYLNDGKILAIKGIGGYHLVCNALNDRAVQTLRQRKFREEKPFAVMFSDVESAAVSCEINKAETKLLEECARPIVLLKQRKPNDIAPTVAPNNRWLGVMLPYTPLHYLIFQQMKDPLVMTSGNVSDEPIVFQDDELLERLGTIADYFVVHNRAIHLRCDDSVYRVVDGKNYPLRRSRGFAPQPIHLDIKFDLPVLACGPEQKNTFALAKNGEVFMSHHIGDMENLATLSAFEKGIEHFKAMYDVEPEVIAYDFHPDYLSTQFAHQYPDFISAGKKITKIGIQHHHAHAVSCMAENGIEEPVIAAVLDGTGRGSDNTIWGGEFLLAEFTKFRRLGCLKPVLMPGGQASIDHPWQMAMGYLFQIFGENLPELPFLKSVPAAKKRMVHYNFKNKINSPITTSCGRLFDAVAAMAGLRNDVFYEGQAAVEFEQAVTSDINKKYSFQIKQQQELLILDWEPMIRELVDDIHNQTGLGIISAKFHNGLANAIGEMVLLIRDEYQNNKVVLSGGVFMNMVLLQKVKNNLTEKNFEVYTHQQVPTNDGGISLGQAVIANAVLQKSR